MLSRTIKYHIVIALLLAAAPLSAFAAKYTLMVQPILPPSATAKAYQPLADYMSKVSGHNIKLHTSPNFLAYWQDIKKGQFDFLMDAAHFTDYKIKKLGYTPLAKVLDVVSFSLVTGPDVLIFEASELVGKPVASLASPSRGALIIEQLFTQPMQQPLIIEATDAQEAIRYVLDGKASGAIIPTPLVGGFPQLNVVSTTEQWPHVTLSASSNVPADVSEKIRNALINAADTPAGTAMLSIINFPGFEATEPDRYNGYAEILKSAWGY